jgi:hypothetical protein
MVHAKARLVVFFPLPAFVPVFARKKVIFIYDRLVKVDAALNKIVNILLIGNRIEIVQLNYRDLRLLSTNNRPVFEIHEFN